MVANLGEPLNKTFEIESSTRKGEKKSVVVEAEVVSRSGGKLHELEADLASRKDSRPAEDITHVLVQAAGIDLDNCIERRRGCNTEGEILTKYGELIEKVKATYPNAVPLVGVLPPRVRNNPLYIKLQANFNGQLRQLAEEKGAKCVSPTPVEISRPLDVRPAARMYHDGLHLSYRACDLYASTLVEYIANFVSRPAQISQ